MTAKTTGRSARGGLAINSSPELKLAVPALAALAAGFAVTFVWGRQHPDDVQLGAAPFFGDWRTRMSVNSLVPIVVAGLIAWKGRDLAEHMRWRSLLACAFVGSVAWGLGLALLDGPRGLTMGLTSDHDYLAGVPQVTDAGTFVRTFTERIDEYPTHVRSHPPGLVLALWWIDRAGLRGVGAPAAIAIVAGASAASAALIAARELAGETLARRAAPFLVVAPAAIWLVVCADALYAGVAAWAVTAFVLSGTREGARADLAALGGGLLLGCALYLSYGLLLIAGVAAVVLLVRRRWRSLLIGALGMAVPVAFFAWKGFWYIDGLRTTRREYYEGAASVRPFLYFLLANVVVFSIAVGPASIVGLTQLRDRALWLLVGSAVVAILIADVSAMSKGEVERIWLPFWPWIGLAAAAVPAHRYRVWIVAQASAALLVATFLFSPT